MGGNRRHTERGRPEAEPCKVLCAYLTQMGFAPGGRVLGNNTVETGFQLLVKPIGLAVGLGVASGGQTERLAQRREQKAPQNWEMNCIPQSDTTSLGNDYKKHWTKLPRLLLGRGQLRQRNEVNHLDGDSSPWTATRSIV